MELFKFFALWKYFEKVGSDRICGSTGELQMSFIFGKGLGEVMIRAGREGVLDLAHANKPWIAQCEKPHPMGS